MENTSSVRPLLAFFLIRRVPVVRKLRKGALMISTVLLFFVAVYIYFVPFAWKEADLTHMVHVIADTQNFDVEEMNDVRERWETLQTLFRRSPGYVEGVPVGPALVVNTRNVLSQLPQKATRDFYPEFFKEMEALNVLSSKNAVITERAEMLKAFKPILTPHEKSQLLTAYDVFSHVCDAVGVVYFLLEASLMGIRRHHGMIPWDDDIDIVVNASQWKTLHVLLSSVPGFELHASSDKQWKFFINTSKSFPDKPFKFPYLDIFFFSEDADYVWAITKGLKHDLVHRKADIFPLLIRPFEGRLVPVPNNLPLLVDASHDVEECITGEYNHKTNHRFYYGGKVRVPCSLLTNVYPFVSRQVNANGTVTETLRLGSSVRGSFTYIEPRHELDQ